MKQLDLRTGTIKQVLETPASNVFMPRTGERAAYVLVRLASGEEVPTGPGVHGTPIVHVVDLVTGADVAVGKGMKPTWSWDGSRLAAYRAVGQGNEIVAMGPTTGSSAQ